MNDWIKQRTKDFKEYYTDELESEEYGDLEDIYEKDYEDRLVMPLFSDRLNNNNNNHMSGIQVYKYIHSLHPNFITDYESHSKFFSYIRDQITKSCKLEMKELFSKSEAKNRF